MLKLKKKSPITVVGINTGHSGGCCIISGNNLVAISEERLNRKKFSDNYLYSFHYCLNEINLSIEDIDYVAFSSYHRDLENNYKGLLASISIDKKKFISIDHHLSHAYSSYAFSGFNEALIIVIDGLGNNTDTESYYIGREKEITKIGGNDKNRSIYKGIGRAYAGFTNAIGWNPNGAGKTMGLSSYGVSKFENNILYEINDKLQISSLIDGKYDKGSINFIMSQKELEYLIPEILKKDEAKNIASFIQTQTEEIVIELIKKLVDKTKIRKVCLAGGVFLNAIINKKLIDQNIVDEVFVPPFTCDTGQCVGNAIATLAKNDVYPWQKLSHPNFGKVYTDIEVEDVIFKKQYYFSLPYEVKKADYEILKTKEQEELINMVSKFISNNLIVGWFQGASEIGARALGSRSILANPTHPNVKDHLNKRVKHRESFRPFAASVTEESSSEYFDIDRPSPFMIFIHKVKEQYRSLLKAVTHVDNTCRVQTVTRESNNLYYNLLLKLNEVNGCPIVLNTSFNDNNEPIVESPRDAINHIVNGNIDVLAINNYLVFKPGLKWKDYL